MTPFDLHVLGTPPAFILSQDQTLLFNLWFRSTLVNLSRFYCLLGCVPSVFRLPEPFLWIILFWNFQGCITVYLSRYFLLLIEALRPSFRPSYPLRLLCFPQPQQWLSYHRLFLKSSTFFIFFRNLFCWFPPDSSLTKGIHLTAVSGFCCLLRDNEDDSTILFRLCQQ